MVISSLYVETVPGRAANAAKVLERMKGVEVHHIEQDYKIVLTLEADTVDESYQVSNLFKGIDNVVLVCLVYHYFGEDEALEDLQEA
ncbi:chaperone NapD [Bacillus sp. FJAT-27251]|uniref:chaperone NapD n=1 Tax=Bacillus sp. FJAT-27251 TaxID=1684142 RepID=UPI0006A7A025|nr:chaperone NapD [Bacillus sp. FJAT-27251]